jgi:hypothetical protein
LGEVSRSCGPEHLSPASLWAVLLEMDCIEPPPVNPLQRIPQSAAEQGTRRTTPLQLSTGLKVGVNHRVTCSRAQGCQHAPGADTVSALQQNGTMRHARRPSRPDRRLPGTLPQGLRPGLLGQTLTSLHGPCQFTFPLSFVHRRTCDSRQTVSSESKRGRIGRCEPRRTASRKRGRPAQLDLRSAT